MITQAEAQKKLFIGYIIACLGLIIGFGNLMDENHLVSSLLTMYVFWSIYWGWKIVYQPMKAFFSNMIVIESNMYRLFFSYIIKKLFILLIILTCALTIGIMGGAVYKQIEYSRIAYF